MKINFANIGGKEWLNFKSDIAFGLYFTLKSLKYDVSISINSFEKIKLKFITWY